MSEPIANRALVAAVQQRIELAHQTGRLAPGRRTLAAELDVSEYAVRRAMDDIRRAPIEPAPASRAATMAPADETTHPDPTVAGNGGRPASPSPDPAGARNDSVGDNGWPVGEAAPIPAAQPRRRATQS